MTISSGLSLRRSKVLYGPWSITLPIARQNTEIMSYSCEENEKDRAHLRRTKK